MILRSWKHVLIGAFLLTGLTLPSPAQSKEWPTRAQERREERLEKLRRISQPDEKQERPGLEKALLYLEEKGLKELTTIRFNDFYPQFGSLSPGSGFAPGVRYYKSRLGERDLSVEASAAYSVKGYRQASFHFGRFNKISPVLFLGPSEFSVPFRFGEPTARQLDRKSFMFYTNLRYRYYPQEDFFGLGSHSQPTDRTTFLQEDGTIEGVLGYQFAPWLAAGVATSYRQYHVSRGEDERFPTTQELFDDTTAPGLLDQPDFLVIASGIFADWTDAPGNPHNGGALGVSFTRWDDRASDLFQFSRTSFDARYYLPILSRQRVLATRFFASFDDADDGSRVPFYLMRTLGGNRTLRGFKQFRFRGENLVYFSTEYRWEPAPAWEMAFFYDTGKVYSNREDFEFENFERNIGFGIRFKTGRETFLRFDIGRSTEGTELHFQFGPAF